ncbi:unnamed protein product [Soboliphyme baturini]|uniref:Uncharacterized protein n=1 Tax=Soboliphyme baturini TaxID=241478 RepID=A0A183JA76_9BILA|nr:unnamed protein product [Soboliphyme baturini]
MVATVINHVEKADVVIEKNRTDSLSSAERWCCGDGQNVVDVDPNVAVEIALTLTFLVGVVQVTEG